MIHRLAIAALLLALLPGCTLSNRIFEEDTLFIEAVPAREDLRTEHPASRDAAGGLVDDEGRDVGDPAEVPPAAREVADSINGLVFLLLAVVDAVMELPITTRTDDARTWGPYDSNYGDGSARLVVSRDPTDPVFFEYAVAVTTASADAVTDETVWDELLAGQFARADGGLRDGDGSFCWDADLHAQYFPAFDGGGLMCAVHRRIGDRIRLHVSFEDWLAGGERRDIAYFFDHRDDLGGVLEYRADGDWVGDPGSADETSSTRGRWLRGGAGRADMVLSGGDLASAVPATECWDAQLLRVYYFVDLPGAADDILEGSEADCVFAEREDALEI